VRGDDGTVFAEESPFFASRESYLTRRGKERGGERMMMIDEDDEDDGTTGGSGE
jgi:hypothetical protein